MDTIERTIRSLGISGTYRGFLYLSDAVKLVLANEELLLAVCNKLYPAVAAIHHTTSDNVERNIRTAISACWTRGDRALIEMLFPYPLSAKPKASELIDALAEHCRAAAQNIQTST